MKNFLSSVLFLFLFATASAQSTETIGYYYQGKKVYFPVSYDRIVVGVKPGNSIGTLKSRIGGSFGAETDSITESFAGKQILIKNGRNKEKDIALKLSKLKKLTGLSFARPVFKSASGKYCSYGEEFIVDLKATTTFVALQVLMRNNGCTLVRKYPFQDDIYILAAGEQGDYDGLKMANLFYETGLFDYAEPNKVVYDAQMSVPNDPLYSLQWAHKNTGSAAQFNGTPGADMKVQEAWAITMGSPTIKIGVIDDGVDLTHPDLQGNLLQGFNGATMTSNPGDGAPLFSNSAHGTACAGIIAAKANNGIGVAGIAPNCKIIPAVIFGSGDDYLGDAAVAASFDFVRLNGADVISNSWGGGSVSSTIHAAITRAVTLGRGGKGCVVLFASGNDNGEVSYPASNPDVIAVGGVSMCDQRKSPTSCDGEDWWGADYGTGLDVVAPCVKIATTDIQGTGGYNTAAGVAGNYYNTFNGTSSACPNAAGVVALMLSVNNALTVNEVTFILKRSCDKNPNYTFTQNLADSNGTWNNELGYGRVNALAAVAAVQAGATNCSFPNIASVINSNQPVCSSPALGSIAIFATGNGALEYSINNGTTWASTSTFNNLAGGPYTVKVRIQGAPDICFTDFSGNPVNIVPANIGINTISYTGPVVAIPDNNATGVNIPITVNGITNNIETLQFRFDAAASGVCDATEANTNAAVDHTYVGDLVFKLTSPQGRTVTIINRIPSSGRPGEFGGNNICNVLLADEESFPPINTVVAGPVAGNFRPANPLNVFAGQNPNGIWTLNVSDAVPIDIGFVRRFSLIISSANAQASACLQMRSAGALIPFISCGADASASQKCMVNGSNLTANMVITAPAGFEVSKTLSSGYSNSIFFEPVAGTVNATPIFIRRAANAAGDIIGIISCSSAGASTQLLHVKGSINTNTIWYVNKAAKGLNDGSSWANAFATLQDALAASRACGLVNRLWVAAGTYYPDEGKLNTDNNSNDFFQLRDGLEIYGGFAGNETTLGQRNLAAEKFSILSGEIQQDGNKFNNSNNVVWAENLSSFAVLDGFTIRDGYSNIILPALRSKGTGLLVINGTDPIFRNLVIQNNEGPNGSGVTTIGNSPFFINCVITGNRTSFANGAVWNENASPAYFYCSIANNTIGGGNDFVVMRNSGTSSPNIRNSIIRGVSTAVTGGTPSINNSIVQHPSVWPGTGNSNADPLFINEGSSNLRLKPCSPAINAGGPLIFGSTDIVGTARPVGGIPDIGAYELPTVPVLYVNAAAAPGGDGSSWATALRSLQDAIGIQYCNAVKEIWVARGIYYPDEGVGMVNNDRNMRFALRNDLAIYGGFAGTETMLSQRNLKAAPSILSGEIQQDNDPLNNTISILSNLNVNATAVLDGFTIQSGSSTGNGGAMVNSNAAPTIRHCIFHSNLAASWAGAVYNAAGSNPIFINCVFTGNTAAFGGAIFNVSSSPEFMNCTFAVNNSASGAAIWSQTNSFAKLTNCIVWGNTGSAALVNTVTSPYTVTNSLTQEVMAGSENLTANPLFVNMPQRDFRLTGCSPAINTGTSVGALVQDILGSSRPAMGGFDMGAYERQSAIINPSIIYVDASATGANDGSGWANAYTSLQSAISDLNLCATGNPPTVLIATGTYTATAATTFNFDKINARIWGGYPTGGGNGIRNATANPVIIKGEVRVLKSLTMEGVRVEKL